MNVTKTTLTGNPSSDSQLTENVSAEQAAKNLLQLAECIKVTAETCARQGECFDQTERAVRDSVLQMGYQAMQLFVALQGDGDLGSEVQTESGKTLR